MAFRKPALPPLSARLTAGVYIGLGILWVVSTDWLLKPLLSSHGDLATAIASSKGVLFVLVSGAVVYGLTRLAIRQQEGRAATGIRGETELRALIESLPVPLFVVDAQDGQVFYANRSVARLTGHAGDGPAEISFCRDQEPPLPRLGGGDEDLEARYWAPGGEIRTACLNARGIAFHGRNALMVAMVDITRRKTAEAALRRKNHMLQALNDLHEQFIRKTDAEALCRHLLNTALAVSDSQGGQLLEVEGGENTPARTIYRAGLMAIPGDPLIGQALDSRQPATTGSRVAMPLFGGGDLVAVLVLDGNPEGYPAAALAELAPLFTSCGLLLAALANQRRREEAENTLGKLSLAVEQSASMVIITDRAGVIDYVNQSFCVTTGYSAEEVIGQTPNLLRSGYMPASLFQEMWDTLLSGESWQGELYNRRKNGEHFWSQMRISPLRAADGEITHMVGIGEDISFRKQFEERLLRQANFDQLTGLPNRLLAFDRLSQALKQSGVEDRRLAVLLVDLDHFKMINESLGQRAGDKVLVEAARRLASCCDPLHTTARLGNDEFLVILHGAENDERAEMVAERILGHFTQPFLVDGTELYLSVSIGVAVAPEDGTEPEPLLKSAAAAMTRAKEGGRNRYNFFRPGMNRTAAQWLEVDSQLRHALDRSELFLTFQPLQDIAGRSLCGAEALLRWQNTALGGLVMPDRFIPLAEETGQIVPIGRWVLRQACCEAQAWRAQGRDLLIAVNTSSRQLHHPGFPDHLREALEQSGLPPDRLELEITESVLMEDGEDTARILKDIADLGVHLSLDDFGTGYSSLSYLKRFPFHTLKIDRAFVRDLMTDNSDRELVRAIIAMAKSLSLTVIAEGVEEEAQLDYLRDLGCHTAQGYLFSRPLPAEAFRAFAGLR